MANQRHVARLKQGVEGWNAWRRRNPDIRPDLSEADLSGADLRRVLFRGRADLSGADLRRADLSLADLSGADLRRADLSDADLSGGNFTNADLVGANLERTNLQWTDFHWADLRRANLHRAVLDETFFNDTDLTGAKGLNSCLHGGPSAIDHRTLLQSGRLPPSFLRGCGVPQELQDALLRIMAEVTYYNCFISYGEPDRAFAEKLVQDLKAKGVPSCWLYSLDATPGQRSWQEIGHNRRAADKMVVLCSVAALMRDGVLKEIEEQLDEDSDKIVPISLDNLWKEPGFRVMRGARDLKPFLLERNYADFVNAPYKEALTRLLRGLERKRKGRKHPSTRGQHG